MRIAQVITGLEIGGATYAATSLARRLAGAHAVTVFAGGAPSNWMTAALAGLPVVVVPGLRNRPDPVGYGRALAFLGRSLRGFDVVHTHSTVAGIVGRAAARLAGIPCIVHTVHGWGVVPTHGRPVRAALVAAERVAARWTHRLVVPSPAIRDAGLRMGIGRPAQYAVIPVGIAFARFDGARPVRDAVRVGFAGRLDAQKSPDEFVHLAAALHRERPAVAFAAAGGGPDAAGCRALARELGVPIEWRGEISDLAPFYRECDVLVAPSRWEGTPLVVMEAMASGCAVVAYGVGGVPDLIEHGVDGLVVPPGDRAALLDAARSLLVDPARRASLGAAARRRAARFDDASTGDRIAALYAEVLS